MKPQQSIPVRQTISPEMQRRLKKIDSLIEKGYSLRTIRNSGFFVVLTDPEGKSVNILYKQKHKNDLLPGFSWIGFFWGPFVAVQIRNWDYFWFVGICLFVVDCIIASTNLPERAGQFASGGISLMYAYYFPYQRWFFSKNNRKGIPVWKSVFIGLILLLLVSLPSIVLFY